MKIISTGSAAPELAVTNEMFSRVLDTSDEWIFTRTGIRSRRISTGDTALSMAARAAENAIAAAGIDRAEIGLVVCASVTNEYLTPSLACLLQRDLGLPESILAFDVNAACSGFIYALGIAQQLIPAGKYALLLGSEHLSRVTDYSDRSTCVLFGDGSGAVIAEKSDAPFHFVSGARGDSGVLYIGASPPSPNPFAPPPESSPSKLLHMDGQGVFRFAVEVMVKSVREVASRAGKALGEITHFVCHQANSRIIENAATRLGVPLERFFMNIETRGNTSAASVPIALDELNATGGLRRGDSVILAGFGGGLTYGAIYLEW
ncbi:MAG: beta-ketoacyl-ACP synthase 3 [Oscillospiraceae bacterium]|jgi:3-oxoacyl-[acyl-carrier-protein] synthase-3|nr:beta-ketoacyl-ACP synthase 3 [Oscillospiraceae bacterium]